MPGYKLQEPQMAELERCVWAQATRVFPRPQLVLLTPGKESGEEVVRAGTLAAAVEFLSDVLRAIPSGPPVVSCIESVLRGYAHSESKLLASQSGKWMPPSELPLQNK